MRNFNLRALNHLPVWTRAATEIARLRYASCSGHAAMRQAAVIPIVMRGFMSRWNFTLLLAVLIASSACSWLTKSSDAQAPEQGQISFLSVVVDADTATADTRLRSFLERAVSKPKLDRGDRAMSFQQQTMPYGDVIRAFTDNPSHGQVARITPYAYVAAEMLGAKLDILAIYRSVATRKTTYRSYFVVRRKQFSELTDWKDGSGAPTLEHMEKYLRALRDNPAKFVYHDRFSTSSYFLPALYFKSRDVFAMRQSINPSFIPIEVERFSSTSSSDLVFQVAGNKADLAAVWDGTKKKFDDAMPDDKKGKAAADVVFIPIPTEVPNDFLVSSGLHPDTERLIVQAINRDPLAGRACTTLDAPPISPDESPEKTKIKACAALATEDQPNDDFDTWYAWNGTDDSVLAAPREGLARLRRDARSRSIPVVVKVDAKHHKDDDEAKTKLLESYAEAGRAAVRLSGTEFVLEDRDLHKHVDMTWTLEATHDGALMLESSLDPAFGLSTQRFQVSFVDRSDLPQRIADLVRSRMRRIRYIWPYEQKYPAVLRDLDFTPDHQVMVQRVSWMDPGRNDYEEDTPFTATIENNTDFSKLRLSDELRFPKSPDGLFNFDPMSNVGYRVVIAREPQASWIWVALPYSFVALFLFAGIGLAVDLRRQQPPPAGLHQTYQHIVETYHQNWRTQEIDEGEVLWADPKSMNEFVKDLKSAGSFVDLVQAGKLDFNFGPIPVKLSVLMMLGSRMIKRRPQFSFDLLEVSTLDGGAALETLIRFLVRKGRLSPFVGFPEQPVLGTKTAASPVEWEALNDIVSRHFQTLGISDKRVDAELSAESCALTSVVSTHFWSVLKKATRDASLFSQTWKLSAEGTPGLVYEGELQSALKLSHESGVAPATRVRVEVNVPAASLARSSSDATLRAWVFGRLKWSVEQGTLLILITPVAIVKERAHAH